jgi:pantoate--beta-alanine ligase
MPLRIARTRDELRETLGSARPGLVPTMGALHAGHLALIARSAQENPLTAVSVFVNPTQFGNQEDLARYPRDPERDAALAADAGAAVIFAPAVEAIYPPGFATSVTVDGIAERWEGATRPGHFRGVATVVTILMNLVQPARTYFGEKDYQQLQVIRRLHRDLALPGQIVAVPTVRDRDGLALSSRNARLSPADRGRARAIPAAIAAVVSAAAAGEAETTRLEATGRAVIAAAGIDIDYLAIVDGRTLAPLARLEPEARLLVAVEIGGTRLIDNTAISPPDAGGALTVTEGKEADRPCP